MGIEALQQQLTDGTITKEQYLAELKKLLEAQTITQEQHDEAAKFEVKEEPGAGGGGGTALTIEQVQKMIQSENDKLRTEYSKQIKALEQERDELLKSKMSEEEKAKFEQERLEKELEEREKALNAREVALHVVDELTAKELPLSFKGLILAESKEDANKLIDVLKTEWGAAIKAEVDKRLKEEGGDPTRGKGGGSTTKKWSEMSLDEQGKLYLENKNKAIELAAKENIKLS